MRFLCELIASERKPWSPINGMLQAAPISWSEPAHDAARVAAELCTAVATDLETVHRSFDLRFPVTLVLTGIDGFEGFKEFIDRCAKHEPQFRDSRAGSRFPLGRRLESQGVGWVVVRLLDWLKGWIYKVFADDLDNASNRRLYYLLCSLRTRQRMLEVQVEHSLSIEGSTGGDPAVLISGLYFGAVGEGGAHQAFGRGLLQKLIEEQDAVAWTAASVRRDRNFRRASFVLLGLAALLLGLVAWQLFEIYRGDFAGARPTVQESAP
jgi:type VI protein secretion system component VasK